MICNNCGAQLPDGTKFCNFCGAQLITNPMYEQQTPPQYFGTNPNTYVNPSPAPEKNSKKPIIIAAIAAIVFVIAVISIVVVAFTNDSDEDSSTDASSSISSSTTEPSSDSNSTANNNETDANNRISRGVINENIYTNSFAEIVFTKPSFWTFATDEELEINFGIVLDGYTEFEQSFIKNSTIYDMMVTSPLGSNLMIMYEDLSVSGAQNVSMDMYVKNLLYQLEQQQEALTYTLKESYETDLGGVEYTVLDLEAEADGFTIHQRYYLRKKGKYMIGILMSATSDSEIEKMEDMFSTSI